MNEEPDVRVTAPPLSLLLAELLAPLEGLRFALSVRARRALPRGDEHPVLLVPGFGAGELAMRPLRDALRTLGYSACDWGMGRNLGMRSHIRTALAKKLEELYEQHANTVTLIGWSLGGVFMRELAREHPAKVRRVITMGSPINGEPDANNMVRLFRLANRGRTQKADREGFERRKRAPPVPCTAIYTRRDGIVAWRACLEMEARNTLSIEVHGTHLGMPFNLEVLRVIATTLAGDAEKISDGR